MDDVNGHTVPCQIIFKTAGDWKGEFGEMKLNSVDHNRVVGMTLMFPLE